MVCAYTLILCETHSSSLETRNDSFTQQQPGKLLVHNKSPNVAVATIMLFFFIIHLLLRAKNCKCGKYGVELGWVVLFCLSWELNIHYEEHLYGLWLLGRRVSCASSWRTTVFRLLYGLSTLGSTVCLYFLAVLQEAGSMNSTVEPISSNCNMM